MNDPVQLALMALGAGVALLWLLVKFRGAPLRRELSGWAASHGFKFHPRATVELSRTMGVPLQVRYEHVLLADAPGGATVCIYRAKEAAGPRVRLQDQDEESLPGDLRARLALGKSIAGRGVVVPRGEKPPPLALAMAPSAAGKQVNPSKRYDMYTDGILEPRDFPVQFFETLDAFPAKRLPCLVIDSNGIWIEDRFHRGSAVEGYEKLFAYCNKLAGALARWTPPAKAAF